MKRRHIASGPAEGERERKDPCERDKGAPRLNIDGQRYSMCSAGLGCAGLGSLQFDGGWVAHVGRR